MNLRSALALLPVLLTLARAATAQAPFSTEPGAAPTPDATAASRLRLAAQVESAWGVTGGSFYNQLAGARFDYRFTNELSLGAYLGYANLKGQDGRAHNVLPSLQLEYRPSLGWNSAFGLPLRFATGYLPQNGPLMRVSVGVSYRMSQHVDLVLDAFTPTFWIVGDRTVISLGGALELSYAP